MPIKLNELVKKVKSGEIKADARLMRHIEKLEKRKDKEELLEAIKAIKIEVPEVKIPDIVVPDVVVPEVKLPEIKVEVPEIKPPEVTIPEIKVPDIKVTVPDIKVPEIKLPTINVPKADPVVVPAPKVTVKKETVKLPKRAKDAIPVRLVHEGKFYRGGGGSTGGVANIHTFATSDNAKHPALVDDDGHVQVDVLSMPGKVDENNSSTSLLPADTGGSDHIFTGVGTEILDYGIGFVTVYSDVASATDGLCIQQSQDSTNWDDDGDFYTVPADTEKNYAINPHSKYIRVVYTNGADAQTEFRLQTILKGNSLPSSHRIQDTISDDDDARLVKSILTGKTSDGDFLNIGSSFGGSLKVSQEDEQTGIRLDIDPLGSMKSITPVRLVGTAFNNGTKDTNFWTETVTGSGTVTQAGQITLSTGTTADSSAQYDSVRKARKVPGTVNEFRMVGRLTTDPQADNVRRAGAYDDDNGYFFEYDGVTFGVGSRKNTVDTVVQNGSFNGNYGDTVDITGTDLYRFVIDYTAISARFFINGILLHTMTFPTSAGTNTVDFPIRMENYNENGNTTDNSFQLRFATILRLGELITNPAVKYIGANATTVLKYGAGILHMVVNNDNSGNVQIYDGITTGGIQMADLDTTKVLGDIQFDAPFSDGLTVVTALGAKITVVYE